MLMIHNGLARLGRLLATLSARQIFVVTACGVLVVGFFDHLTGYEISISLLYVGPVIVAAWYAGRLAGAGISLLACASWFVADAAAGQPLAHPVLETWNFLVRLGHFLVLAVLAAALRRSLSNERQLARTDALTGLLGRRAFGERLEHDLAIARRRQSSLTIAYLDLDNFKALNDTYGHAEGDRVLCATSRALGENRRGCDTVARLGGDEFALVFPDTDPPGAHEVIAKLRHGLQEAMESGRWRLSCSVGAVTFQSIPPSLEEALSVADRLMYEVKRSGKDAVAFKVVGPEHTEA